MPSDMTATDTPDAKGLATCPFCGGEAEACDGIAFSGEPGLTGDPFVHCHECSVAIPGNSREDAIAAWNRRALASTVPAEVEGLAALVPVKEAEPVACGEGIESQSEYRYAPFTVSSATAALAPPPVPEAPETWRGMALTRQQIDELGYAIVPKEPTEAMHHAYTDAADPTNGPAAMYLDTEGWTAMLDMLAAAPSTGTEGER
jgi:hypothetical protein